VIQKHWYALQLAVQALAWSDTERECARR